MERMTKFRAGVLLALVGVVLCFFCFKLYAMQVVDAAEKGDNTTVYITRTRVRAARGEILDTNGNPLVSNRASYDLEFNHYVILNSATPNETLRQLVLLCKELGIEYIDHFPVTTERPFRYTLSEYNSAWQGYFQKYLPTRGGLDSDITAPLLIKTLRDSYEIPEDWTDEEARLVIGLRYELSLRNGVTNLPNYIFIEDVSEEDLAAILELNIPGLNVEASTVREYHTEYAAHVLGYVGAMSPSQWEYYSALGYEMDAMVGQSGFEEAFEEYLHGTDGIRVDKVAKDGTVVESYYEVEPKSGNNVEVSIDLVMQMAAEDALEKIILDLRNPEVNTSTDGRDAEGGAVVALDAKTGQVLVCASYPTFDLATMFENYNDIKEQPFAPFLNRALMATYPPGSTYKMAMVLAGIESNTINIDTTIFDKGVYTIGDYTASCLAWTNGHYTHGSIECTEALQRSCNYFFYELSMKMDIDYIDSVAKQLGLGESTGVELFEYLGTRANPITKAEAFAGDSDRDGWYAADQLMTSIGQSLNRFTPMQMAVYTSTLCNQGTRYRASFLNRVVSSDYSTLLYENKKEILSTLAVSNVAFEAYSTGMEKVAQVSGGTAYRVFGNYPIKVAAKTGTAETGAGSDNGAFVCYAPADDPEIVVVVYVEKGGHGSTMANVAKSVLDVYFDIDEGFDVDSFENQVS